MNFEFVIKKNFLKIIIILFVSLFAHNVKAEVKYKEILNNPTDLKLNLKYAREQEKLGNFKNVIATLERLTALYPENIDLKLYLLSIAVKTDSTEKVLRLVNEIRQTDEIDENTKRRVAQVFDDINKKKINETKKEAMQQARDVVNKAEQKRKDKAQISKSNWIFYQDFGWKTALHTNVGSISNSQTKYSSGAIVDMTGVKGDNIETINYLLGATYQINNNSNLNLSIGTSSSEQNRGTSDENDTNSFSASYSNFSEKNVFNGSLSLTDTNTRRAADSISRNFSLNNNYNIYGNHKILSGLVLTETRGNQNPSNASKRQSNTFKAGLNVGYQYLFSDKQSLTLKYAFNETEAIADYNGLTDDSLTISYSNNFPISSFGISYSKTDKEYNQIDSFIHPSIIRNDNVENYTISLNGSLGQLFNSTKFIKTSQRIKENLNTFSYSLSLSETNNNSNWLQNDYEKKTFNFGLTKRIYF
ncbi:hypothetical protein [Candidatus Pelagibacter sp. HIMB1782]|uniref:tetratricopeptide repeat protein n=1 Tax=Candidatus Pelagibacter sp. HIMB1782 TaxID=3413375 RepID=UPI003F838F67